ncbi:hypothetical protein [Nostoc sp. 'Peltigera membranacea cyanobiont' N6]|nr:hypothetical protein [Nostoc sp. 'Peltigera membranacea cyanobiont' N6]
MFSFRPDVEILVFPDIFPQLVTASPVWTLPPTTAIVQTKPAA